MFLTKVRVFRSSGIVVLRMLLAFMILWKFSVLQSDVCPEEICFLSSGPRLSWRVWEDNNSDLFGDCFWLQYDLPVL